MDRIRNQFIRRYRSRKYDARLKSKSGGRLELDLGRGNDNLHVRKLNNGLYRFNVHDKSTGRRQTFDLTRSQVSRLTVKLGRGNDRAVIDPNVDQPFSLQGNRGKDTIHNGAHGMRIDGGKHRDKIINSGSFVHMRGGKHRDHILDHGAYNSVDLRGGGTDSYTTTNGWGTVVRNDRKDRFNGLNAYERSAHWNAIGNLAYAPFPHFPYLPPGRMHHCCMPDPFLVLARASWGF